MVKIWLFLMLMSTPNQPTVKYNALIYPTEEECLAARESYMEAYEAKPREYRDGLVTEGYCIPFDSFPIVGMPPTTGA